MNRYEDLIVWQKSFNLVMTVYQATKHFPSDERFGLSLQARRCAVSIPSNIAEGFVRHTRTDYLRFLDIARGSTYELQTQMRIATGLNYLPLDHAVHGLIGDVERLLNALIQSLRRKSD